MSNATRIQARRAEGHSHPWWMARAADGFARNRAAKYPGISLSAAADPPPRNDRLPRPEDMSRQTWRRLHRVASRIAVRNGR